MRDTWIVGAWQINLGEGWIARRRRLAPQKQRIDGRLTAVLGSLIQHAGETVSTETLLNDAWPDRVVSRDSVTTAIYQLRQLLGDAAEQPNYIVSEHRRGYRLIAPVRPAGTAPRRAIGGLLAASLVLACTTLIAWQPDAEPADIYVEPMLNYTESPVQEPLLTAIETTLLGELIQTVPGRIRSSGDDHDADLRLQSMLVACDLGPTLVMRLLDTRSETYVWSETYNLDEVAADPERPSLVERAASDVSAAIL